MTAATARSVAALKIPSWYDTHAATVGASGAGKTVTSKRKVERLLEAGRHVVVIDPTGSWWGMQSNAAGDGPGFDIPIFGGLHANVPIGPGDGAAIAAVIVEQRINAIVDLSEIHDAAGQRRFMAAFVARLRAKEQANLHLVVDEADEFCPQTPADGEGFALLQDMIWVAKRGRVRGFVLDIVTQRPADISKAVLSQVQTIVAHQLIAPQDQAAIDAYLKANGTKEARAEVMASLPELPRGERWVYSPREKLLERGVTPALLTFDSSATPEPGEERAAPRAWSEIDADAIRAALAKEQPAATPRDPKAAFDAGTVAGEALQARDAEIVRLGQQLSELEADVRYWRDLATSRGVLIQRARDALQAQGDETASLECDSDRSETISGERSPAAGGAVEGMPPPAPPAPATPRARTAVASPALGAERKPLAVLAGFAPAWLTDAQWATIAGFKRTGGTWSTYRSRLRSGGLIEQVEGKYRATAAGVAAVGGDVERPPAPGAALIAWWADRIPGANRMLLRLGQLWPNAIARDALAADLNMSAAGGTFGTYLSRLRGNGLLEEKGKRIRVAPALMGEGL